MNKSTGFSIRVDQQEQTLAAVGRADNGIWPVRELISARDGSIPPQELTQAMARNRDKVLWMMPNDLAKSAVIPLPQLKGKEMTRAVRGWVAREEQGVADDYSITWRVLPKTEDTDSELKQKVFVLYGEEAEVQDQIATPLAQTIMPGRMLPGFMVLDEFHRMTRGQEHESGSWNLVFLGTNEKFLLISSPHSPLLTRGLPFDLSEGAESDQYVQQLATEIDRSGFYVRQGDHSGGIVKTIVAGDPVLAAKLVDQLEIRSEVPAETWDTSKYFDWGHREIPCDAMIPLMAAAMSLDKSANNMLPDIKRSLVSPKARRKMLVAAGSVGLALLPVLVVGSAITAKVQEGYLKNARGRLDIARMEAGEAAEIYKRHRLLLSRQNYIQSFHEERPDLEAILSHLGAMAPSEVQFRDLRVTEDDLGQTKLTLTGWSEAPTSRRAHEAFLDFQEALDDSPLLESYMEPLRLAFDTNSATGLDRPQTVFQMKYMLVSKQNPEGEGP